MYKGILFALGACAIWGLVFVIPQFMRGFSPLEVALGRFFFYGIISFLIFCQSRLQGRCRYPRAIWKTAVHFSLILTFGTYTFVVLSLRHSTPAICALVLGISPIIIAFYGNWKQKETSFRSLILPSCLILIGLLIVNIPHIERSESVASHLFGLVYSVLALTSWSWYVVANLRFIKQNPEVRSRDWPTIMGVATLFWAIIFALVLGLFFENQLQVEKYLSLKFYLGSAILGVLCSWLGNFLWNRASLHLPVSLAGQLTILETIFGVLFFYMILERNPPPLIDSLGILVMLIAIIYGIRQFAGKKISLN